MTKKVLYMQGNWQGVVVNRVPNMQPTPANTVKGFAADVEVTGDPCFLLPRCNRCEVGSLLGDQRRLAAFVTAILLGDGDAFTWRS